MCGFATTVMMCGALCLGASSTPLAAQSRVPIRTLTLTSPSFSDGGLLPDAHAQRGRDRSPALTWQGAPDSVRSFVLVVRDLDA
ncbi:MAG TPA: hypothetical protein PKE51_06885, partial [Gemmatimonadaceae bacterium]|nr:hypothetical protein [Gemmatimonadaceae bacterium]